MLKHFYALALLSSVTLASSAQVSIGRVVCHDPSIFMDGVTTGTPESPVYYIYGSHLGHGKTTAEKNYINWSTWASDEGAMTADKSLFVDQNGNNVLYSSAYGDAHDWQAKGNSVKGMQWAPDVIYNKQMKKWCMYMSLNGDSWCSVIVLFTSDRPDGGWKYAGPVVYSGFQGTYDHNGYTKTDDYKHTDLEKVIGEQTSLPARYKVSDKWGEYWPNCIDPCVFYDAEDKLWMSYGSWSGGIFMFQLDESTGLRDYSIQYKEELDNAGDYHTCTSDPYFGKKIAGGYYVSGEASYIQRIGKYYYLFMSYGGLSAVAGGSWPYGAVGYQMRIFRSENPDGPYMDCNNSKGQKALFSQYQLNFGKDAVTDRGTRLMSAYKWDSMTKAEIAQGHNSAIVDHKGRALVVYHTRQVASGEGHSVRVHQLFQNQDGWLVAAPYEFYGEEITQEDIDTKQIYNANQVAGEYDLIVHKIRQDAVTQDYAKPEKITLGTDGKVTGAYQGTWKLVDNTGYVSVALKGVNGGSKTTTVAFKGVIVEQTLKANVDPSKVTKALCFTALSSSSGVAGINATRGVCIWGTQTKAAEPSGIEAVLSDDAVETNEDVFDIFGRKQEDLQKGLNIKNGRILLVK